jgi:hypothetical protein
MPGNGAASLGVLPERIAPYVFVVTATDPAGNKSTVTHSWHIYKDTQVVAEQVVPNVPTLRARLSDLSNTGIAGQTLSFSVGQAPGGVAITCSGNASTNGDGVSTCNIGLADLLAVTAAGGYRATFNDTPPFFGSSGSAGIA